MRSGTRRRKGAGNLASRRTRSRKVTKAASAVALDAKWEEQFDAEFERDQAHLEQSGRTLTRVLFGVFLAIALLMLVVAMVTGISTSRKLARERDAVGQVTGMTERQDSEGNSYFYPVVAFDVPDGGRYNVQLSEGTWPPDRRVGDLVTVLYDEQNPMDARLESRGATLALWTWTLVSGILAIAFLLAATLAWTLGRAPRPE